ncbi:unnamed protein product [Dracunculus medinensis]|uniref:Secreted protein n=1 Tax=Dracunculus medinensis TaxID=318479 RepID=A0A0N4URT5_DRAME|nr:unnamed protein product [Dracunculus medinensis]
MYFIYLPYLFFISSAKAGNDKDINVCNRAVPAPPVAPGAVPAVPPPPAFVQRPTVDPNLCADLDPACSAIFAVEDQDTLQNQRDP